MINEYANTTVTLRIQINSATLPESKRIFLGKKNCAAAC